MQTRMGPKCGVAKETFGRTSASRFAAGLLKVNWSVLHRRSAVKFYRTSAVEYLLGVSESPPITSTPDKPKKPDLTQFAGYTISTSSDSGKDGTYGIAFCPICDDRQESHDHGHGAEHAILVSLGKVRTHMRLAHKVKDEADA